MSARTLRRAIKAGHVAAERNGRGFRISLKEIEHDQASLSAQAVDLGTVRTMVDIGGGRRRAA